MHVYVCTFPRNVYVAQYISATQSTVFLTSSVQFASSKSTNHRIINDM